MTPTRIGTSLISFQRLAVALLGVVAISLPLMALGAAPGALRCEAAFRGSATVVTPSEPLMDNLYEQRLKDLGRRSESQVKKLNTDDLERLVEFHPGSLASLRTGAEISHESLQRVLHVLKNHEVVGPAAKAKYAREEAEVGYCFGRALFLHVLLRKMGLQENSIRKVWVVGPQKSHIEGVNWGFHVATIAYVKGNGWMSIDTTTFKVQPVEHWYRSLIENSIDGKPRFYVTPAERFGVSAPKYSRLNLGLDLNREEDFYRHYFVDMMKSLSSTSLESMGLTRVQPSKETVPATDRRKKKRFEGFKDFFWG